MAGLPPLAPPKAMPTIAEMASGARIMISSRLRSVKVR
jgi:hypothetical protein